MNITVHIKGNGVRIYTLWKNITTPIAQCNDYNKLLTFKKTKQ